jgi:hypothetical protein
MRHAAAQLYAAWQQQTINIFCDVQSDMLPAAAAAASCRQLHANEHVQVKVVGNYAHGWKGFAFKVGAACLG